LGAGPVDGAEPIVSPSKVMSMNLNVSAWIEETASRTATTLNTISILKLIVFTEDFIFVSPFWMAEMFRR
jgi:hypothetical protein